MSTKANPSWPANAPGWACFPIEFAVRGHTSNALVGNVITPIQQLLHIKLG